MGVIDNRQHACGLRRPFCRLACRARRRWGIRDGHSRGSVSQGHAASTIRLFHWWVQFRRQYRAPCEKSAPGHLLTHVEMSIPLSPISPRGFQAASGTKASSYLFIPILSSFFHSSPAIQTTSKPPNLNPDYIMRVIEDKRLGTQPPNTLFSFLVWSR